MKKTSIILAFLCLNHLLSAQDGTLDNTFGINGKVATSVTSGNDKARDMLVQTDGKIIVAGDANFPLVDTNYMQLVRYNPNGSLDDSFGTNGKVTTSFPKGSSGINAMALQTDGKIVAVGFVNDKTAIPSNSDFAVVRYNTNGTLDASFDGDGRVTTDFSSVRDIAYAVTIQTDGKIVVVGDSRQGNDSHTALLRYNTDGSLDASFNSIGKVITPSSFNENYKTYIVKVLSDNKIMVTTRTASSVQGGDLVGTTVTKYTMNGALDNTFGRNGYVGHVLTEFPVHTVLDNGKILIAGMKGNPLGTAFTLSRLQINGAVDSTFGVNGKVTTFISGFHTYVKDIAVQKDGKIVLAADFADIGIVAPSPFFGLIRCTSEGVLDNTFGTGGTSIIRAILSNEKYIKLAIQNDDKILACGAYTETTNKSNLTVVRYNNKIVGIRTPIDPNYFVASPNPVNDVLNISWVDGANRAVDIKITDRIGRVVYQRKYDKSLTANALQIDLQGAMVGIYILTITSDKGSISRIISKN